MWTLHDQSGFKTSAHLIIYSEILYIRHYSLIKDVTSLHNSYRDVEYWPSVVRFNRFMGFLFQNQLFLNLLHTIINIRVCGNPQEVTLTFWYFVVPKIYFYIIFRMWSCVVSTDLVFQIGSDLVLIYFNLFFIFFGYCQMYFCQFLLSYFVLFIL